MARRKLALLLAASMVVTSMPCGGLAVSAQEQSALDSAVVLTEAPTQMPEETAVGTANETQPETGSVQAETHTEAPGTEAPGTETPGTETPGTEAPGTEAPGTEAPGTEAPGTEVPGTEAPGTENPGPEALGTEVPDTETIGAEAAETETPGTEVSETGAAAEPEEGEVEYGLSFIGDDRFYPEYEDGGGWQRVYADESAALTLDTSGMGDAEYRIEWEAGRWAFNGTDYDLIQDTSLLNYVSGNTITIPEGCELGEDDIVFYARAWIGEDEVASSHVDLEIRQPEYQYHGLPGGWDALPGWGNDINRWQNGWLINSANPDGAEAFFEITDLSVAVDEDCAPDAVECWPWEDENGWHLQANSPGHAVVTVQYNLFDGAPSPDAHTFDVWVGGEVYGMSLDTSTGSYDLLPGASLDLVADVWLDCYDAEEGEYRGDVSNVWVEWSTSDESYQDVLSFTPDEADSKVLHVTANEDGERRDVCIEARAYIPDQDGDGQPEEVMYDERWINVTDGYYTLEPVTVDSEVAPGAELAVAPVLNWHENDNDHEVTDDLQYRWEWDTNCVEITDADGKTLSDEDPYGTALFTLKKLQNWHTDLSLVAERPNDNGDYEEVTRRDWHLNELGYNFWLENLREGNGRDTWMYSDEDYRIDADLSELPEGATLVWEAGYRNWDVEDDSAEGAFTPIPAEAYTADGTGLTLHGDALYDDWNAHDQQNILVRAYIQLNGVVLDNYWQEASVNSIGEAMADYQLPGDISLLPYWGHEIDRWQSGWVDDSEHPYGEEFRFEVTGVSVAVDEDCEPNAVEVMPLDENPETNNGWHIQANSMGHAVVTMQYEKLDGTTGEHQFHVWVGGEVYNMSLDTSTGSYDLLPGASLDLTADVWLECFDEENGQYLGDVSNVWVEWTTQDENYKDVLSFTPDEADSKVLHVTANEDGERRNVCIEARAYIPDQDGDGQPEEVVYDERWINVTDGYYTLEPVTIDSEVTPGAEFVVEPVLNWHETGKEPEQVTEEVQYGWAWDTNCVEITDADGKILSDEDPYGTAPFTLKKLQNWHTDLSLVAEHTNDNGDYEQVTRRDWHLNELEYNFWLENLREGNGRDTWMFSDEDYRIDVNTEELPEGVTFAWQVGYMDWDTEEFSEIPEGALYTADETGVTLHGPALYEDWNAHGQLTILVRPSMQINGITLDNWVEGSVNSIDEPELDYQFPSYGEDLVPGQSVGIGDSLNCWVRNADYLNGANIEVAITDLIVEVDEDCAEDAVAIADNNGFRILQANSFGHAVVTLQYNQIDGTPCDEPHIFDIWVTDDIYRIMLSSDSYQAGRGNVILAGESTDVTAYLRRDCYDEEQGQYQGDTSDAWVEWKLSDESPEGMLTLEADAADSKVLHVTANKDAEYRGYRIEARVMVQDENGEPQEVTYDEIWIDVTDGYYQFGNVDIDGMMQVEASVKADPVLLWHTNEGDEVCEADFRWSFDPKIFEIRDANGTLLAPAEVGEAPFTIRRIGNGEGALSLIAEVRGEDNWVVQNWLIVAVDEPETPSYGDIFFENLRSQNGLDTWMFSDEDYRINVNKDNLTNGADEMPLEWSVGYLNEETRVFTPITGTQYFTADNTGVTLHGEALYKDWAAKGRLPILVRAYVSVDGSVEAYACASVNEIYNPQYTLEDDVEWDDLSLGMTLEYADSKMSAFIQNSVLPQGKEVIFTIEKIETSNPAVISCQYEEKSNSWILTALAEGSADITYTVTCAEAGIYSRKFVRTKHVAGDVYRFDVNTDTKTDNLLPGASLQILPKVYRLILDNSLDLIKTEPYEGRILVNYYNYDANLISVDADGKVTAGKKYGDTCIQVVVTLPDANNGLGYARSEWIEIHVVPGYYLPVADQIEVNPGDTFTVNDVHPVLKWFDAKSPEGKIVEATFKLMPYDPSTLFTQDANGVIKVNGWEVLRPLKLKYPLNSMVRLLATTVVKPGEEAVTLETTCDVLLHGDDHAHTWDEGVVKTPATCTEAGSKEFTCQACGTTREEAIPATGHTAVADAAVAATCTQEGKTEGSHCSVCGEVIKAQETVAKLAHSYDEGKVTKEPTIAKKGVKTFTCTVCGATKTKKLAKLKPVLKLNATSITLKTKQSTEAVKIVEMAKGDKVSSWKSSNTKIVKVDKKTGKITAQSKTGSAKITVTLKSGKKATVKVKVQSAEVKTKKITEVPKKLSIKKGKKYQLAPVLSPLTSSQKLTYKSSNTKVAKVSKSGKITAVKAGTATITVKSGSKTVKVKVTVKK